MLTFTRLFPIIYVQDLDLEVAFYRAFGFTIRYQCADFLNFVAMQEGEVQFGIEERGGFNAEEANRTILWQFQVNNLAEAVQICDDHGFRYRTPKKYLEMVDGWEMQVWSPNGYKLNLEGRSPVGVSD